MTPREFPCVHCGDIVKSRFKLQKYCSECAILRDLNYGMKARDCSCCGTTFWPIRNTYRVCAECIEASPGNTTAYIECPHCEKRGRTVPATVKACLRCVETTEETRARYREVLRLHVRNKRVAAGLQ